MFLLGAYTVGRDFFTKKVTPIIGVFPSVNFPQEKYAEPKKKLSQNRTSRWAYSLRKKRKSTPTSNETEISNEINDFQTVHEL